MSVAFETYLGRPASALLADSPFNQWPVEKSIEEDLEPPVIDYVFPKHGLELRCDWDDTVNTIFLHAAQYGVVDESLFWLSFSSTRRQVRQRLGSPSKSGGPLNDAVLGPSGAWDRFTLSGHTVHDEYRVNSDCISMITLMRPDVVP